MIISDWLFQVMSDLGKAGVDSPRRDALVLLEDTLEKDRSWVLAHHDFKLSEHNIEKLDKLIKKRIQRQPLAYIRGKAWFYGRFFIVNKDVLIPRPESEAIIELAKEIQPKTLLDVGTGSGCLAITAKLEMPSCTVSASDISKKTLALAEKNAKYHNVKVSFISSSLLKNIDVRDYELFLVNLPYVPDKLITSSEIEHEPKDALFAGEDGLDIYREFWTQVASTKSKPEHIITESLESQHQALQQMAEKSGYELTATSILVQQFSKT